MLKLELAQTDNHSNKNFFPSHKTFKILLIKSKNAELSQRARHFYYLFLNLLKSENNLRNKQETKKLTTAPITDIMAVNSKSFMPIFKAVDNSVPPMTPDLI